MTLFTGKGDDGTTRVFGCDQRISKSADISEALGALDEVNSFLGLVKVKSQALGAEFKILNQSFAYIVNNIQQNLFIIQAEVAGSKMTISEEKLKECESYIHEAEKILPPIKTFFVSGGTELASVFDIARTLARKAERRVVKAFSSENTTASSNPVSISKSEFGNFSLAYLNRLSSLLYVLARLSNHFSEIVEDAPLYK